LNKFPLFKVWEIQNGFEVLLKSDIFHVFKRRENV